MGTSRALLANFSLATFIFALFTLTSAQYGNYGPPTCDLTNSIYGGGGSFTWPNQCKLHVNAGALVNVTWTTKYQSSSLYWAPYDDPAVSQAICIGTTMNYCEWTVPQNQVFSNMSQPFSFHVVEVGYTPGNPGGGFWSYVFFIIPPLSVSSSTAITSLSTSLRVSSTFPASTSSTSFSRPAQRTGSVSTRSLASATAVPAAAGASSQPSKPSSTVIGLGVGFGALAAIILALVAWLFFRRRRRRQRPSDLRLLHYQDYKQPPLESVQGMASELSGLNDRSSLHELGDSHETR